MNKYEKWYNDLCERGKLDRNLEYAERHHIIPECFFKDRSRRGKSGWLDGNPNESSNLTRLSEREHKLAHYLLVKIYKDNKKAYFKMLKAFEMVHVVNQNQKEKRHFSSRLVTNVRAERAKIQSELMRGENNPQYGRKWTTEERKAQGDKVRGSKLTPEQHARLVANTKGKKKSPRTEEHLSNLSANHKSKKEGFVGSHSEETKEKMRLKATGRKQSEETIKKKADAIRGSKREKKHCPHCNQMIAVNTYSRWHGPNCKNQK